MHRRGGGRGSGRALRGHLRRQRGIDHRAERAGGAAAARGRIVVGQRGDRRAGAHVVDGDETGHGGAATGTLAGLAGGHRVVGVIGRAGRALVGLVVAVLAVVVALFEFLVVLVELLVIVLTAETQLRLDIAEHALAVHGASCFVWAVPPAVVLRSKGALAAPQCSRSSYQLEGYS